MSHYVDGYVLSIKKDKIDAYKKMAQEAGEFWMKHGALAYFECKADDMDPAKGQDMGDVKMAKFPHVAGTKEDEITFFSFIIYKSRAHRDEVNEKVMSDPEMGQSMEDCFDEMPFDVERMAFGGFEPIVNLIGKLN